MCIQYSVAVVCSVLIIKIGKIEKKTHPAQQLSRLEQINSRFVLLRYAFATSAS